MSIYLITNRQRQTSSRAVAFLSLSFASIFELLIQGEMGLWILYSLKKPTHLLNSLSEFAREIFVQL
jgi:hypothetical protein